MKVLDTDELDELFGDFWSRITIANRNGTLEDILRKIGWSDLLGESDMYHPYENGIITVIGESEIKEQTLIAIAEDMGIDRDRLEFCLSYKEAKTLNYRKFYFEPKYRAVLFGPVPHSTTGKGDYSSVITEMESREGYPQVIRIAESDRGHLKITKTSFRRALAELA